jgi:hypothetical protein
MDKRVEIANRATKAVTASVARDGESRIQVPLNSNVKIDAPPKSLTSLLREGDDLILKFEDGSSIRLEGYFACPAEDAAQLTIDDPATGADWLVNFDDATCYASGDATSEALAFNLTPFEAAAAATGGGMGSGLLIGLGALALGGIAAAAGGGGGGGSGGGTPPPTDTTPPAAPVVAPSRGTTVSGTAEAGATVRIDVNGDGTVEATVTAGANGAWTYTPPTPIANGTPVSVVAVDAAGNASVPTRIVVDALAPAAPTIDPTNGTSLTGTAEAGSTVLIDLNGDGTPEATVTAGTDGRWTYTPATPLADGTTVTVTARDAAGNVSPPTSITLDFSAPPVPVVGVTDDVGAVQGLLASGGSTDDTRPTLTGTAEVGATISVYDGTTLLGTTTAGAGGAWTFTPTTPLAQGAHSLTVTATDAAGNTSAPTAPFTLTVDTTAPVAPTVSASNGTGLTGTAEPGSTVAVDITGDGIPDGTTQTDGAGNWSFVPGSPIPDGTTVTVTASDAAGNVSPPATVVVDSTVPLAPVIATVVDDVPGATGIVPSGGVSNDPTLTLTGTAEAGATVTVYDGAAAIGTVTADGAGLWTFTTPALAEGAHALTATATDATGNVGSASVVYDVTIDLSPPAAPLVNPTDGVTLSGTAEVGATVLVDINGDGTSDTSAVVAGNGQWSVTFVPPLADGTVVSVIAVDPAGNASPAASATVDVVLDTTPPPVPVVLTVTDDVAPEQGLLTSGAATNDATPTLSGIAEAGVLVSIYDGTTLLGTTNADGVGLWSFTPAALADGPHSLSATTTDTAGNESLPSPAFDLVVDTAPPLAPGIAPSDGTVITGTAEAGAFVGLDLNGDTIVDVTVQADPTGAWSYTPLIPLGDGVVVTAIATDAAGNASPSATTTIDALAPLVPAIATVTDDVGPAQGLLVSGAATDDAQPTLAGTTEAGATITVYDGGVPIGTATADGTGAWSFTPTVPLTTGSHSLTITATDALGNQSAPSAAFVVVVDTAAPVAPAITTLGDNVGPTQGTVLAGGVTDDLQPLLSGTSEANATITVYGNGASLGTTTADGAGLWSFTPTAALGQGAVAFTVTATDAAGNVSPLSAAYAVTIDNAVPATPAITGASDDVGTVQGALVSGAATDDTLPGLSGTADPNAAVTIFQDGVAITTVNADALGVWSYTIAAPLAEGTYSYTASVTSAAGVVGALSPAFVLTVDTTAPTVPSILTATDDAGLFQGPLGTGAVTDDIVPVLSGLTGPGATVTIFDNGAPIGSTVADGSGAWSFSPTVALTEGAHAFTATATDAAGNTSLPSPAFTLTVDTTAPDAPIVAPSSGLVLTGTAEADATINLDLDGNGTVDDTTVADGTGAWTYTPAGQLPNGTTVIVTATDAAGNTSGSDSIVIDSAAPVAPFIFAVQDDIGPQTGTVPSGGTTDDTLPVLTGSAEAGSTVTVFDNGIAIGEAVAGVGGQWTFPVTTALAAGPHVFTASAEDALGNVGPASAAYTVAVDTSTPIAPVITTVVDNVGTTQGGVLDGGATDDALPAIGGTAPVNATISVYDGAALLGTTTSDGTGAWSFTPTIGLGDGPHSFTAIATNAAGNVSLVSNTYGITIDTVVPTAPQITLVNDDFPGTTGPVLAGGLTNDTTPTITGSAEPNSTVSIFNNGVFVATAPVDGAGTWTYTPTLVDGPQSITVSSLNAAGNASPLSTAFAFTVDATPPAAPIVNPTNGSGTLAGTAEPGAIISVDVGNDGGPATVLADATTGAWTYLLPAGVTDATPIAVTATDAAGNTSTATIVLVDQILPLAPTLTAVTDDQGPVVGPVVAGGATNDTLPVLTGTAENNATVTILDNGTPIGTVQAGPTGAWTFTPATPLVDGPHSITITATDAAGNTGPATAAFGFTVVTTAPAVPAIVTVTDNQAPQLGTVAGGGSTNDVTPVISGTGDVGAIITLYIDGVAQPVTTTVDGLGAWSFTPTLAEGPHTFTVTATNAAGLVSGTSGGYAVIVDLTPPPTPLIDASDGTTVSGDGEVGATIQLFLNGDTTPTTTATVDAFGQWSATFAPPLADGTTVTAVAVDAAGNFSGGAPTIVDTGTPTTPPAVPVITAIADDVGTVQGPIVAGTITNDTAPLVSGTSDPDALITIYDNGLQIGTTTATPGGTWSFTPPVALGEGPHSFSATATEGALQSLNSPPIAFTVDLTPPPAPVINPSNGTTLTGTAEAGAFVDLDLDDNGSYEVTVQANGAGVWSYTPGTPLVDGTIVNAIARDVAGNASTSNAQTIDRAAPATPTITSASDDVAPVIGIVPTGGTTNDTTPTLTGTAEAGSTVSIYDGAGLLGTTVVTGAGTWTFTAGTPLADGGHSFTITATDPLGNVSTASTAYTLTILTGVPAAPVIIGATDDVGTIVGPIANGGATNDNQPALTGTAEAGSVVSIFDGATLLGTAITTGAGTWSFTPPTTLADGTHGLTAIATNAAGTPSAASAAYTVTVDTAPPVTPVLTAVTDDVGTVQGALANGATTNDALPTLTGTAEAGSTVSVFDGATLLGTTTASGSGAWSFTPTVALATGAHALTVTATDAVGNQSTATTAFNLTVDTTAPLAPVITSATDDVGSLVGTVANGGSTDDAAPLLTGTAEAGSTVSVFNNGALLGTTVATGTGAWTFTPLSPLAEGAHSFTAISTDVAGNASVPSSPYAILVDTTPPAAPAITTVTDDVAPQAGALTSGAATNDTLPSLTGTAEANATVAVYDNGALIGSTTADGTGAWSFTPTVALIDGNHSLTVRATDTAGNQSAASSPFAIRVDTVAPLAPVIASVTDDVGTVQGPVLSGGVTNDTIPLLRGTAEASSTLTLFANGTSIGTTQVDATGNWSFSPATALAEGTYAFTAAATDAAGNVGVASPVFTITVDTTAPAVPVITSIVDDVAPNTGVIASGGLSNDATPQLTGTGPVSTTLLIYDNGVLLGSTTSNASGAWSFTPGAAIANGAHSFTAVAVDPAGNASGTSNTYGLTVDTVAPTQTIAITTLTTDTGTLGDWSTQDTSPTIGGTLSAALGTGEQVQIQIDGGTWVNATASGNTWFYGGGTLAVGSHPIAVRVIDAAGNVGNGATQTLSITAIPAQAPIVQASSTSLLGLVGVDALNLLGLNSQAFTAFDPNNNLRSVTVRYAPLLALSLGAYTLTASTALAAELGLQINIANNAGFLGILAPSSALTITAIGGGAIDNLAVNELLGTVHFQQNVSTLGVDLLSSLTITATDNTSPTNLTSSASVGSLLDLSLLNSSGSANLFEGGAGNDTLNGTGGNDRLYGHGGNDVLNGNGGDDFLRGGAGADTLNGGTGNDTLVYDAADTLIDGGAGIDTLLIDTGTGPVLNFDAVNNIRNIEVVNLGTGDAGRSITLTEAGVLRATDTNHQLTINGDGNDSVTMTGAVFQGQSVINGEAYNHYTLGTTNIFVDHPVMVVV